MTDFISQYFVNPILYPNQYDPYNIYNTVVYALLALAAIYLIFRFLQSRVKIGPTLFYAIIPFVVFGSSLRVLEDAKLVPRQVEIFGATIFPFVTPYIYILTVMVLGASALMAWLFFRKTFLKSLAIIGAILALPLLVFDLSRILFPIEALAILGLALFLLLALEFIWRRRGLKLDNMQRLAFFGQVLDGSASFIAIAFGTPAVKYAEQHVVGNILIGTGSPLLFLLVKIAFAALVLEFLRREYKEESNERNYILLLIMIMGLAPGLRDLLRLAVGV